MQQGDGTVQHTLVPSLCRLCINTCGILVDVQDGRAVHVIGDRNSPAHHGYTCVKGRALPRFLRHPDRILRPLKRVGSSFEEISSEQAMDEIAERITTILGSLGPRALAGYSGTYHVASPLSSPVFDALLNAIGTPMRFSPGMIDKPGKLIARAVHGRWMAPAQGFDDPQALLLIGINPLQTYTGFPYGNPRTWLRDRLAAGMSLIVIDPRRTDVARRSTLFLQPRAGQDIPIVAGMIRILLTEGRYDREFAADNVRGVDELRHAVEPFTPNEVAFRADVPAADVVAAARLYAAASRGYAMAGTGPNMSGRGTLLEYLVLSLETLCGRWLRAGEVVRNPGVLIGDRPAFAQAADPTPGWGIGTALRVRGLGGTAAGLPTAALAEEILMPGEGQVRALISSGGNPVAAWPDQALTAAAMRSLELLVQVDPWMSQTAQLADYVIPPRMVLEAPSTTQWHDVLTTFGTGYGTAEPYGQYVPAVCDPPPGSDLLEEWQFFYGLGQRLGLELSVTPQLGLGGPRIPLDMADPPTSEELLEILSTGSRIPLAEVRKYPHGRVFSTPEMRVAPKQDGWTGRLDVANPDLMADLADVAAEDAPPASDAFPFRLLCRRMKHVYNSSCNDEATNGGIPYNPAFLHPDDLAVIGADDGDLVEIRSRHASVVAVVAPDHTLRRGVVSMAFAFGGVPSEDGDAEVGQMGTSVGRLLRADGVHDPYSGQPLMSNVPVALRTLHT